MSSLAFWLDIRSISPVIWLSRGVCLTAKQTFYEVFTFDRNRCSFSNGIGVHFRTEYAGASPTITIPKGKWRQLYTKILLSCGIHPHFRQPIWIAFDQYAIDVSNCISPHSYVLKQNDFQNIKYLLHYHCDVNTLEDGRSLLSRAVNLNDYSLVLLLLKNNANTNITDPKNCNFTPLSAAVAINSNKITDALLKSGADPNIANNFGDDPINLSIQNMNLYELKELLQHNANPNIENYDGNALNNLHVQRYIMLNALHKIPHKYILFFKNAKRLIKKYGGVDYHKKI